MSPDGQGRDVGRVPEGVTLALDPDAAVDWHSHEHHQLAWASSGVLVMAVAEATWVLPRSRALWIPAGTRHSVATVGATVMLSLFIEPQGCPISWAGATLVDASGLVGPLCDHLADVEVPLAERAHAEALLWDLLAPAPVTILPLPMPSDDRARRVAEGLLADLADGRSLGEWGREAGASSRTLARRFTEETGMGFERWRSQARISAALPLLATGTSVAAAGRAVGYASPSAFVAAFRRQIGTTPGEYFRAIGGRGRAAGA